MGSEELKQLAKRANSVVAQSFERTFKFNTLTPHVTLLQLYPDTILNQTKKGFSKVIYATKEDIPTICLKVERIVSQTRAPKLSFKVNYFFFSNTLTDYIQGSRRRVAIWWPQFARNCF